MKLAYQINHPQTGTPIVGKPDETPLQAIQRYNETVLGYTPEGPEEHELNQRWTDLYPEAHFDSMRSADVQEVHDPDTFEMISLDEYIANYPRYVEERKGPFRIEAFGE